MKTTSTTHRAARANWRNKCRSICRAFFASRPQLHIDEWADRFRYLSEVNSAEPGLWRSSRVPWITGIGRAIEDPDVRRVVVQKPAQVGYTEGVLGNTIGYHIDLRPRSIVVVQPSDSDAEDWSKDKLHNMIEATPVLRGRVSELKSRGRDNTILAKSYPGGRLRIVGGTSPKGLARTSAPLILVDEVDRLPLSAGKEGDPLGIVAKRGTTFPDRKEVYGSTPTIAGASRIVDAIADCELVFDYYVPCPACGHFQTLKWGGRETPFGVRFDTVQPLGQKQRVKPGSVFYECERCHVAIEEEDRNSMVAQGEWRTADGKELFTLLGQTGVVVETMGFRIGSVLISPFDGCRWEALVQEWLDAQGEAEKLQVFFNTRLGLPWDEAEFQIDADALLARQEKYPAEVPAAAGVLVAAVDVQTDRLEVAIDGYGLGEESWLITHQRLYGDPEKAEVWDRLEAILTRPYAHELGAEIRVSTAFIDSGYATTSVYDFVRPRQGRRVYASKGMELCTPPIRRPKPDQKYKIRLCTISTTTFKNILFNRLGRIEPGPGYMHFCSPTATGADAEYFAQFKGEIPVRVNVGRRVVRKYKEVGRNEAIDLKVMSLAALQMLFPTYRDSHIRNRLDRLRTEGERNAATAVSESAEPVTPKTPKAKREKRRPRRNNFVYGW